MDVTRRKLFGIGTAAVAAAAVPAIADAKPADEAVKPVILEHTCDGGASRITPEEVKEIQKEAPWMYRGCGTKFQFYWGNYAYCPNCGYAYICSLEDLKTGFYKRIQ